ncbi:MAG: FAD-dependent oxidoreductase [Coriobacteriales bacterium]|nr:FAD-dependent oxidoreductase [Coriobacteriales bacterium]
MTKIVIVGGVAGGASAATRARRLDEQAHIVLLERGPYVSFANCGLPYYVGSVIKDRGKLAVQTPQSLHARFNLDVRVQSEVVAINTAAHEVTVRNLQTDETYVETYDKLLLSPGAEPVRPPLPGADLDHVLTVRNIPNVDRVTAILDEEHASSCVVVGGGFIGIEMAENLAERGIRTSVVEMASHVIKSIDADMAADLHAELRKGGVGLRLNTGVSAISQEGDSLAVHTSNGETLPCDFVILAVGVRPESAIARNAGIACGPRGHILVDDRMHTSAPDVYAAGDAIQVVDFVTGADTAIPLAGPANRQGRIAAENMLGGDCRYTGTQGSSVVKVFSLCAASTGLTEEAARAQGIAFDKTYLTQGHHAGYYPGARMMGIKVLWDPQTGKLLGAQAVGPEGVDKRIDVIATAIRLGADVRDLASLELCYAPPFGSAKDPVNMAGFVAENVLSGKLRQFFPEDVADLPRDGSVTLLDVRTPHERVVNGFIDGFVNIPVDEIRERADEIPQGKPVYVHCKSGQRSYIACRILTGLGYTCYNLAGGFDRWSAATRG